MKHHFLYQTTNIVNGKIYIGIHSSFSIHNDNYKGSGVIFRKALKKYGSKNFIREVIAELPTRIEIEKLEALIVTADFCKLDTNYNVAPGGRGGCGKLHITFEERSRRWKSVIAKTMTPSIRKSNAIKAAKTLQNRIANGTNTTLRKIQSVNMLRRWAENRDLCMLAVEKIMVKLRCRTKENDAGRLSQSIKISGNNNPMKRKDVLDEHFIGKTKDNCDWRARQAITITKTQANFSIEKKAEIGKSISMAVSGKNNGMYGRCGELSPASKYTETQKLQAYNFYQNGMSRKNIAKELNVNYQTIKVWIRNS